MPEVEGAVIDAIEPGVIEGAEIEVEQPESGIEQEVEQDEPEVTDSQGKPGSAKQINDLLKNLKATNPQAAAELRKAFNAHNQYSQHFKTPFEAQAAKTQIESLGGAEGIAALQTKAATVDLIDEGIVSGNREIIDDIFSDPNMLRGFSEKLLPYALDKLKEGNPKAYAGLVQPGVVATLNEAGLEDALGAIYDAIGANKLDDAKNLLQRAYKWLQGEKGKVTAKPAGPDPERQKLEEDRKAFQKQQQESFKADIDRETITKRDSEIEKVLAPYLKLRKLAPETRDDLVSGIRVELKNILTRDPSYTGQIKAHFASPKPDRGAIVSFISAKAQAAIPQAIENVWKRRGYGAIPKATAKPGTNGAVSKGTGVIMLSRKPTMDELERGPGYMELYMGKRGVMKDGQFKGRQVQWR